MSLWLSLDGEIVEKSHPRAEWILASDADAPDLDSLMALAIERRSARLGADTTLLSRRKKQLRADVVSKRCVDCRCIVDVRREDLATEPPRCFGCREAWIRASDIAMRAENERKSDERKAAERKAAERRASARRGFYERARAREIRELDRELADLGAAIRHASNYSDLSVDPVAKKNLRAVRPVLLDEVEELRFGERRFGDVLYVLDDDDDVAELHFEH